MLWVVHTETVSGGSQSINKQRENKHSMLLLLLGGAMQCRPEDKFDQRYRNIIICLYSLHLSLWYLLMCINNI